MEHFSVWKLFGLLAISGHIFWFKDIIKSYFSNFKESLIYNNIYNFSNYYLHFMDNFLKISTKKIIDLRIYKIIRFKSEQK